MWKLAAAGSAATLAGVLIGLVVSGCAASPSAAEPSNTPTQSADGDAIQKRSLEALAKQYELDPAPDVQVVRRVDKTEWASTQAECLQSAGFAVMARPDGGVDTKDVPEAQLGKPFGLAMYTCMAQYPIDAKYYVPYTDKQLETVYKYLRGPFSECVANLGYAKPDLPSLGVFVDSYRSQDPFDPFGQIAAGISEDRWFALNQTCPPEPPSSQLFSQ